MLPQIGFAAMIATSDVATGSQSPSRLESSQFNAGTDDALSSTAVWTEVAFASLTEFTATATSGRADAHVTYEVLTAGLSGQTDETPPGNKVPEPASLMLVGTGLLAVAKASRMSRLRRKYPGSRPRRAAVPIRASPRNSISNHSAAA